MGLVLSGEFHDDEQVSSEKKFVMDVTLTYLFVIRSSDYFNSEEL